MSDLKNLSWSVQETVEPVPFEEIQHRGVRRRHRRQALAGLGVATATTVAVLAALLPFGDKARLDGPPVATVPTAKPSPGQISPITPPVDAQNVIRAADADVQTILMATPTRWVASWASCSKEPCRYAAVLSRDGATATTPVRQDPYITLQAGDEAIAVAGPSRKDSDWGRSLLVRLTAAGKSETALDVIKASSTFSADEILTNRLDPSGAVMVLNLQDATVRPLELAPGHEGAKSPVRDSTGRWWLVIGQSQSGSRSDLAWTDDGGKYWNQALIDPDNPGSTVAVSQDGRTIVASSWMDGATFEAIGTMVMSTDAGATWKKVTDKPWARGGGPVAFNDGTAVMLGLTTADLSPSLYVIAGDGRSTLRNGVPDQLDDIAGDGRLLYGRRVQNPHTTMIGTHATMVATSTDRGETWSQFEPR